MTTACSPHRLRLVGDRRQLLLLLVLAIVALLAMVITGAVLERAEGSPLVRVGQPAPDFSLPATTGGRVSLAAARGHPVVVAFVPSAQCGGCRRQLRTLEAALPDLAGRQVAVVAISTDEPPVQETISRSLHLSYPFLAENVVIDRHPAGHAYGVFHLSGPQQGPVDANALFVVDAAGIVRAVDVRPAGQITAAELVRLVNEALGQTGARR